ncbi:CCA tRNA nucleotidyltransferase, partial [Enterococcus lactis]|nr:CCA tRNA nucleotidyltransferase [Enterococcus lactis]
MCFEAAKTDVSIRHHATEYLSQYKKHTGKVGKMKLKQLPLEYQKAIPVLKKLENAGYEAYFVGGSVRDILLNQPIHDVDIATSAFPEE